MKNKDLDIKMGNLFSAVRCAKLENSIIKELRKIEEKDAYELIAKNLPLNKHMGLILANRVLNKKEFLIKIFKELFVNVDASGVKYILKYIIPKLGFNRFCRLLLGYVDTDYSSFSFAMYWLPNYIPQNNEKSKKIYLKLFDELQLKQENALSASYILKLLKTLKERYPFSN